MAIPLATITNNFLKCGVCLDTFRDPRSLPCQHAFCLQCLESCAASRRDKRSLVCPTCRKKTMVSQEKIKDLPVHFLARSLKDTVDMEKKSITPSPDTTCGNCDSPGNKAKVRCMDCKAYLCGKCYTSHKAWKLMKDHRIVTMEDIISGKVDLSAEDADKCEEHGQPYRYYCKNERKLICQDCVILKVCPTKHNKITVEEAAEKQKTELEGLLKKSADTLKMYQEAMLSTESTGKELKIQVQLAKQSLQKARQDYISAVDESLKSCESKIDQIERSRNEEVEKKKTTLELTMTQIQKANEDATKVMQCGSKFEIIAMHGTLSELGKLSQSIPATVEKTLAYVKFEATPPVVSSIGQVVITGSPIEEWELTEQFSTGEFNNLHAIDLNHDGDVVVGTSEKGVAVFSRDGQTKFTLHDSIECMSVCVTPDNKYVTSPGETKQMKITDQQGRELSSNPLSNQYSNPSHANSLAVDPSGKILVGLVAKTISIHNTDGTPISKFATEDEPLRLAVTSNREIVGSFAFMYDDDDDDDEINSSLKLMDYSGNNIRVIQPPPEVTVWNPSYVCCGQGEIFVINTSRGAPTGVYRFTSEGDYLGCVTTDVEHPTGIALARDGMELFVADYSDDNVKIFKRP